MKRLHTFQLWESPQAGMFQELLAKEGIACLIKNDRLASALGEIPFIECQPELWVIDDEVYPRAKLLLEGWLAAPEAGAGWVCPGCGEEVGQQFGCCWNCRRPRQVTERADKR